MSEHRQHPCGLALSDSSTSPRDVLIPLAAAAELIGVSAPELAALVERAGLPPLEVQQSARVEPAISLGDVLRLGTLLGLRDGSLPATLPPGTAELAARDEVLDSLDGWRRYAEVTTLLRGARGRLADQERELADMRRTLARDGARQAGPLAGRLVHARVELGRVRARAAALELELHATREAERRSRAREREAEALRAELAAARDRHACTELQLAEAEAAARTLRAERAELRTRLRGLRRLSRTA
jgi:hypothetical protein